MGASTGGPYGSQEHRHWKWWSRSWKGTWPQGLKLWRSWLRPRPLMEWNRPHWATGHPLTSNSNSSIDLQMYPLFLSPAQNNHPHQVLETSNICLLHCKVKNFTFSPWKVKTNGNLKKDIKTLFGWWVCGEIYQMIGNQRKLCDPNTRRSGDFGWSVPPLRKYWLEQGICFPGCWWWG